MNTKKGYGIIVAVVLVAVFGYIILKALGSRDTDLGTIIDNAPNWSDAEKGSDAQNSQTEIEGAPSPESPQGNAPSDDVKVSLGDVGGRESSGTLTQVTTPEMEPTGTSPEAEYSGSVLAGSEVKLLDFVLEDYNKALKKEELVVLYFYANWCPTCKAEVTNGLYPAFNDLTGEGIVGFRVNYKDNETDSDEEDLARKFGVGYQHTKIFVKNGERVLKAPDSWSKDRYLSEIAQYK